MAISLYRDWLNTFNTADILESSGIAWPNPSMWRRGHFNPSMPVPTQHPTEGAETHLHSPRRQPSSIRPSVNLSGHPIGVPGLATGNTHTSTMLSPLPMTEAVAQKGWTGPASNDFNDPFDLQDSDPLAYVDWGNTTGPVGINHRAAEPGRTSKNSSTTRKSATNCRNTASDTSMPDFIGMINTPTTISEAMNYSGANLEDSETTSQGPQVPTNTPTTMGLFEGLETDSNKLEGTESMFCFISDLPPPNRP